MGKSQGQIYNTVTVDYSKVNVFYAPEYITYNV